MTAGHRRSRTPGPATLAALGALVILAGSGGTLGQGQAGDSQTTFRSAVDLVDVEVSVLDQHRLPVRGLTAADFTVLEDGKPRPIAAFTQVNLPTRVLPEAPWMDEVPPDVHSNTFAREGRLVVILLDASIEAPDYPEARRIAEAAVEQLRDGDMGAIAWSMPGVPQNFTADRQRLLDVIRRPVLNVASPGPGPSGICPCGLTACSMESIATIAEGIQDVGWRRKMLVVIGRRLAVRGNGGGCSGVVEAARKRALRAAEAGNLTIHVIDPHGLDTLAAAASASSGVRPPPGAELRRISGLRAVTDPTGGRLVVLNGASSVLPEVFRESDSYYVLGFEPAYTGKDGRFVRISVKVNRPDVTLQARRGYYATGRPAKRLPAFGKNLPASLVSSIAGLWPKTELGVSLSVAPVAVPGVRGGAVAVVIKARQDLGAGGPDAGALLGLDRPRETRVNVLTGAFDSNGKSRGVDQQTVTLTPKRSDAGLEYEVASRLVLEPGRYEIRAAVEDTGLGRSGSAYTYIDVPDFARELVSLSGVFVQTDAGGAKLPGAELNDLTPLLPTTRRTFSRSEEVIAFVREYQGLSRSFMPGYATTEIFDRTNTRVYRQEQRLVPESPVHRGMDFRLTVPVSRLDPGPYVLKFEVRHGNETARRDLRFQVE